ncbi:hypothetical protein B723_08210 [Pseudomonas fluorescens NCIMB 11764]|uniref:Uncharacterized protein n=1 Tax=Pseudomonas fluorescens NCIMB 11764 TaxID=1221522 RepID=A0A0K1QL46_PSEFL|nr:hypothetical protein B723_08210 [Pseudomonas fluorescens NCIMB 11764]
MTLMDLPAIDTCVPAVTARGAIVEKGQKRCKAIGDYLNSSFTPFLFALTQTTVGASLLAMRTQHSIFMLNVTPLSRAGPLPQGLQPL